MKNVILCFILAIGLLSFTNPLSTTFTIDGIIDNMEDYTEISINYTIRNNGNWEDVYQKTYVIDHKFHFQGNITELTAGILLVNNKKIPIFLEPAAIKVVIDKNSPYNYTISGISVEEEGKEILGILSAEQIRCDKVGDSIEQVFNMINMHQNDSCLVDSLMTEAYYLKDIRELHSARMDSLRLKFVTNHISYRIAPCILYELARNKITDVDTIAALYRRLPESTKKSMLGKLALEQINETALITHQKELQEGDLAPDFSRRSANGKIIQLSDFRNKEYILLDFWASWCGPCLKQIPQIKKLQSTFADRGLRIIGISSDENEEDWLDAINRHRLDAWEQILGISDLADCYFAKSSDIMRKYNIKGIPQCFLIDKQGRILLKCHHIGEEEFLLIDKILP